MSQSGENPLPQEAIAPAKAMAETAMILALNAYMWAYGKPFKELAPELFREDAGKGHQFETQVFPSPELPVERHVDKPIS